MHKKASGECGTALNAAKSIGYGLKREVEPEAEFLWRDKVVEMEITHGAITFVLMAMAVHTEVLCFFLVGVMMT